MRKIIVLFLFLFSATSKAQLVLADPAENVNRERFIDRLYIGGNFGLQFGSQTYVEVAPIVGYRLTDKFSAGIGIKYIYFKFHDDYTTYSTNIYGGGPFARYFILENLFLHTEFEVLNLDVPDPVSNNYIRQNITSVFVGAGYRQLIGENSGLDLLLLYNINESSMSPYENPIIRIGFALGL